MNAVSSDSAFQQDNASVTKLRSLPPRPLDFNPIEHLWNVLEHHGFVAKISEEYFQDCLVFVTWRIKAESNPVQKGVPNKESTDCILSIKNNSAHRVHSVLNGILIFPNKLHDNRKMQKSAKGIGPCCCPKTYPHCCTMQRFYFYSLNYWKTAVLLIYTGENILSHCFRKREPF